MKMMVSDFHTHVLPCIDDGSASLEESLQMLRREREQAVSRVIATPHFYAHRDTVDAFLKRREMAAGDLHRICSREPELPQILLGAEVHYFKGMSGTGLMQEFAIEGTKYVLIEMPYSQWTEEMYRELADLPDRQGLQPIIAHIDRYLHPLHSKEYLKRMLQLPVLLQANAGFFLNAGTGFLAMRMLSKGQLHLLGSDCHNMTTRPPNLEAATDKIREKLGGIALRRIAANEKRVLGLE